MPTLGNALYTMEAANLFAGKAPVDVTESNHLALSNIKLPSMEELYVDHRPGGGPVTIEIDTGWQKLNCDFTLAGWTPQVASLIDSWNPNDNWFFMYGLIRNRVNGSSQQAMAKMRGRLGKADPQAWERGQLMHWAYSIKGIVHYELFFDRNGAPTYFWDFFNNQLVVNGVDRNADLNAALNLGAGGAIGALTA